jgi:inosose dehydratase
MKPYRISRRDILAGIAGAAGVTVLRPLDLAGLVNVSAAAAPAAEAEAAALPGADVTFGYASISWAGKDQQAIDDIAALGFKGIQLRSNIMPEWGDKPAALRDLLKQRRLTFVALSSGNVTIDPAKEAEDLAAHSKNAKFVKDAGGLYLQVTDSRPKRDIVAADYKRLAAVMTELGKRTADLGIPLSYHNHMNSLGEKPGEVDAIMDAADPRYVKLELDVAHYQQGGGDPVKAIDTYASRLLFLHIKDVASPFNPPGGEARPYEFVELGRGRVDLKNVFAALDRVGYKGWAIIELDRVYGRTPKEAAAISKQFVETTLKRKV